MSEEDKAASEGQETHEVNQSEDSQEDKDRALKIGWVDKPDFKGDPSKWRPAKEYLERGENYIPILKSSVSRQERKIAELEQTIKDLAEYNSKAEQNAYKRAIADLKAQQEAAVETGDKEAFRKIDQEISDLQKEASETPKFTPKKNENDNPAFDAWVDRNEWFKTDFDMHETAVKYGQFLRNSGSKLEDAEFLEEVTKKIKEKFPEKFQNARRNTPPAVEGSGGSARKGGKSFDNLPPEAKAAYDRFQKQGIKITKEEYVKNYEWE